MANENNPTETNREATTPAPAGEPKPEQKTAPAQPEKSQPAQK